MPSKKRYPTGQYLYISFNFLFEFMRWIVRLTTLRKVVKRRNGFLFILCFVSTIEHWLGCSQHTPELGGMSRKKSSNALLWKHKKQFIVCCSNLLNSFLLGYIYSQKSWNRCLKNNDLYSSDGGILFFESIFHSDKKITLEFQ